MFFSSFSLWCCFVLVAWATQALAQGPPKQLEPTAFITYNTSRMIGDQPHHHNMTALLIGRFQGAAELGAYPFQGGSWSDFEPIFQSLIAAYPNETCGTIADDDWAQPFVEPGNALVRQAEEAQTRGDNATAYSLFLRAQTVFRISHFPWVHKSTSSTVKLATFQSSKAALRSAMAVSPNISFEEVPLKYDNANKYPDAQEDFVVWHFRPAETDRHGVKKPRQGPLPTVLVISGLGLNKPDQLSSVVPLLEFGYAAIVMDMPGTGDAPITGRYTYAGAAGPGLPPSDVPLWRSVYAYIESEPSLYDSSNLFLLGLSTAGYWTTKVMHVLGSRFVAGINQGGPTHYTFTREWLNASQTLSYPCNLPKALGLAFGYTDSAEFIDNAARYSLLNQSLLGVLQPGQIISVDGFDDLVFPVDDQVLLTTAWPDLQSNATDPSTVAAPAPMLRLFPGVDNTGEVFGFPYVDSFFQQARTGWHSGLAASVSSGGVISAKRAIAGSNGAAAHVVSGASMAIVAIVLTLGAGAAI